MPILGRLSAVLLSLLLVLTACGGEDDEKKSSSDKPSKTSTDKSSGPTSPPAGKKPVPVLKRLGGGGSATVCSPYRGPVLVSLSFQVAGPARIGKAVVTGDVRVRNAWVAPAPSDRAELALADWPLAKAAAPRGWPKRKLLPGAVLGKDSYSLHLLVTTPKPPAVATRIQLPYLVGTQKKGRALDFHTRLELKASC